jgi:DNA-binding transcriptional MerR regulator
MPDDPLFTLRELADQLSLPESTVRYYRDAFLDHIPSVGTGRRRRYPPAAVAVLRSIATGYGTGLSRAEILRRMDGAPTAAAAEPVAGAPKPRRRSAAADTAEVTNLDLLAAIVDGEREQREALWQMAQEIVRLTEVLESQEKVLAEIGDHTGFTLGAGEPRPFLAGQVAAPPALGRGASEPPAPPPAPPTPPAPPSTPTQEAHRAPAPRSSWLQDPGSSPPVKPGPLPGSAARAAATPADPSEIGRLRQELEAERQLVDRLREAKLKLEQRTAEAEGAVEEERGRRRSSVISRLLNGDRDRK